MKKEDEILEMLAGVIKNYIVNVMKQTTGRKITDKEAENILQNVAMYLMKKNNIIK